MDYSHKQKVETSYKMESGNQTEVLSCPATRWSGKVDFFCWECKICLLLLEPATNLLAQKQVQPIRKIHSSASKKPSPP